MTRPAETVAVLLAAGRGTRMRSSLPKPLVPLAGRGLVLRLLDAVVEADVDRSVVIVGHQAERVEAALPDGVQTAHQSVRDGTASAVQCAREAAGDASDVLVFVGDSPLLSAESIRRLVAHRRQTGAGAAFLTSSFPIQLPYARVIRDEDGACVDCIEERDCTPDQAEIREYLTSHYAFDGPTLWRLLPTIEAHATTKERYLTDILRAIRADGGSVETVQADAWEELVGLNTPEEVEWAEGIWAQRDA
jgi:bifunctional N-acetylglucosamine-1-phosphate-uridyltransferase/glucosamine-1-phosphate-acetyltransferase GlmU-like protein